MDLITYGLLNKAKANLDSPAFTGTPTAPTPATTDSTTKLATTEFVRSVIATLKGFYLGVTTTTLVDEVTTNPDVVINGETVTAQDGNWVIASGGEEFVYSGTVWQKFGDSNWISVIGNTYNASLTYNTNDCVIYMDGLYICKEDNITGAWDSTKWNLTNVIEIIRSITLTDLTDVNISSATTDDLLTYNGNNWVNEPLTPINDAFIDNLIPKAVKLVSFTDGTNDEIIDMINGYYNGNITLDDVKSVWSLGDTRSIDLSAMEATGVSESHRAQTVQVEILDFDHDTLTTPVGSITKALITVDLKNCLRDATVSDLYGMNNTENGYMNSTNTNVGGWTSCARRSWCNNIFYNALPLYLKENVKAVNKLTSAGNKSSTINTDSDYCFLLSEIEIFGNASESKAGEGSQYAGFANATANIYKLPKWNNASDCDYWWYRSPNGNMPERFCYVTLRGLSGSANASFTFGLAPAFCL